MIAWLIIASEILFWLFIFAGLFARYVLKWKRIGIILLFCTPLIDLFLLMATIIDLKNGETAHFVHALSAVYIGVSVAFGRRMIQWADEHFSYRFAGGVVPKKHLDLEKNMPGTNDKAGIGICLHGQSGMD